MTEPDSLSESLRRYAEQVPFVLSVENLRRSLVKAADALDRMNAGLALAEEWFSADGVGDNVAMWDAMREARDV